jgi:tetratricopeptide (TPR) repeat protein
MASFSYEHRVLQAAKQVCQTTLVKDPADAHILHLSGLLAAHDFHDNAAIAYLTRAVMLERSNASWFVDLAKFLSRRGLDAEATGAALRSVKLAPRTTEPYRALGKIFCYSGQLNEAEAVYKMAIAINARPSELYGELGAVLLMKKQPWRALGYCELELKEHPSSPSAYYGLAQAHLQLGAPQAAIRVLRDGIQLAPLDLALQILLADAMACSGSYEGAASVLRDALSISPLTSDACRHLIDTLQRLGRTTEVIGALLTLGESLQIVSRYGDAADAYRQALELKPDCLPAQLGLGHMLIALGQYAEAHDHLKMSLIRSPKNLRARIDLATVYHLSGDPLRGWQEFASYYDMHDTVWRTFEQPLWDGTSLNGRTVLLWTLLGRGDSIHFLRYIKFAREHGGRIIVECNHPGLADFVERMPEVERVVRRGSPLPSFDVHAPLVFFPSFLRDSQEPRWNSVPYISPNPTHVEKWARRLARGSETLVGLCWGGNIETAPGRFMALREFEAIKGLSGLRLVSLQHGPQAAELLAQPPGLGVEPLVTETTSMMELAGIVVNLDLVISVDTMVAHVAGALGVPVWTVLRYATNWRWPRTSSRSPWYPTMRLFRQTKSGDWQSALCQVRSALEDLATRRSSQGRGD